MTTMRRATALATCLLAAAACGDPDTDDARGYTKAPLENPGWTVEGEKPGGMAALGAPIRIPSMDTAAVDTSAPPTTTPQSTTPQTTPQSTNPQTTTPPPAGTTP